MKFLSNVNVYKVVLLLSALGLIYWQYDTIVGASKDITSNQKRVEMSFVLNSGNKVTIPDDLTKYTVLIFWRVESAASLKQIDDLIQQPRTTDFDSTFTFYFVNVGDSLDQIKGAVSFENNAIPYGYQATGDFLEQTPIKVFPYIIILKSDGMVENYIEGYREGELDKYLASLVARSRFFGPTGNFKF